LTKKKNYHSADETRKVVGSREKPVMKHLHEKAGAEDSHESIEKNA